MAIKESPSVNNHVAGKIESRTVSIFLWLRWEPGVANVITNYTVLLCWKWTNVLVILIETNDVSL